MYNDNTDNQRRSDMSTVTEYRAIEMQFVDALNAAGMILRKRRQMTAPLSFSVANFTVDLLQKVMTEMKWESQGDGLFPMKDAGEVNWFIQLAPDHDFTDEILAVFTMYDTDSVDLEFSGY
jgi:hypothetical protein